jgi:transglutaminase-like putative cysteine protease
VAWRLRIRHVTGFTYEGQAHASYNEARLTPMTLPWQVTLFSQVDVHPAASTYRYYDYWGTLVTAFDLQRQHGELKVVASSLVETDTPAPITAAGWDALSAASDRHAELLAATTRTTVDASILPEIAGEPGDVAPAIASFARENVAYVPGSTGVQTSQAGTAQGRPTTGAGIAGPTASPAPPGRRPSCLLQLRPRAADPTHVRDDDFAPGSTSARHPRRDPVE